MSVEQINAGHSQNNLIAMDMTLKYARGISYSQLYKDKKNTIEKLVKDLPTCESVVWLSFLVHQKITLTVKQAEIHIMAPLLYQFNSELQHKILSFIGGRSFPTDQLFDLQSLLKMIEYLLQHHNSYRRELNRDDKSNLFKAYLLICDDYLVQQEEVNQDGTYSADDMLKFYMPFELRMNTVLSIKFSLIELVKSKLFLVDFASNDQRFSSYIDAYIRGKHCESASKYILMLFSLSSELICNKNKTNIIKIDLSDSVTMCSFLDNFCINVPDNIDEVNIQEKPLYKVANNTYCFLYIKFFVNKFFHSLLFDLAKELENQGLIDTKKTPAYVQIKQLVGQKFTEQYLFYKVIDRILADKRYEKKTGEDMTKISDGLPDFYANKGQRVFLFEFKDIQLNRKVVTSGDYDTIIKAVENELVENEKGRPKGITQLANDIDKHLFDIVGKERVSEKLQVYPILVYSDSSFDIEGFNYYLNNRFHEIIRNRNIPSNIHVKDVLMVNIDTLIMFEKAFVDKKLKFDVLVNEYISYKNSKEQYQVVPFNKFLFQKAKQKGCFFKASYLVKEMIAEMAEKEKTEKATYGN